MRTISATLALKPVVAELGAKSVAGTVTDALAALAVLQGLPVDTGTMVSTDVLANATLTQTAITAIGTQFGSASGLRVFIDESGTPTRAQVIAALEAVIAQIKKSNAYL